MSLETKEKLTQTEATGRTIARAHARRITAEEIISVSGGLPVILPSQATSSACYSYLGVDWGGRDE